MACKKKGWALAPTVLSMASIALHSAKESEASPLRDVYHRTIPLYESFLKHIDAFDEALWKATEFSEKEIWEMILHSALAAQNSKLEAVAQRELLSLGVTEMHMAALYRLDPEVLSVRQRTVLTYAQRSGVLPTRVNAEDISALRVHYGPKAVTDIILINAYANMYSVLYGSGFVGDELPLAFPKLEAQLSALNQEKVHTPDGWTDRHLFESPALQPELTHPYLAMDQCMLIRPHSFSPMETWEMFVVGQKASDCRHCVTHGAFGMHLEYAAAERIVSAYNYNGSGYYSPRDKARLDFVQSAMKLPSTVAETHREALAEYYDDQEIQHLTALTAFMGFLSTYMQTTAVITDDESADFAIRTLGPEGFELGRHVGPIEQQRKMHPTTMYRLAENAPEVTREIDYLLLWMDNTLYKTMKEEKFPTVPGPVLHVLLQLFLLTTLLLGFQRLTGASAK